MTEEILEVDEDKLVYRVGYIKEKLLQISTALRGKIPPDLTDQDLTEDNAFKQWIIVNSIYDASIQDEDNDGFNRLLYYLFDKSKGNVARLVNNYDINISELKINKKTFYLEKNDKFNNSHIIKYLIKS